MGNLKGKKIKMGEDLFYDNLKEINNLGLEFNELNKMGFIKNNEIIIPKGEIGEIIYDNNGNDFEIQFGNINLIILNDFNYDLI